MTRCINELHEYVFRCSRCNLLSDDPRYCAMCDCDQLSREYDDRPCSLGCTLVDMFVLADGRRLIGGA